MCPALSRCTSWEPCEKFKRNTFTPATIKRSMVSGDDVAGPTVATILVRRCRFIPFSVIPDPCSSRHRGLAQVARRAAQVGLDAQQPVVLREPVRTTGRTRLDLTGVHGDRQVRDERVLGLAAAVADDVAVPIPLRQFD